MGWRSDNNDLFICMLPWVKKTLKWYFCLFSVCMISILWQSSTYHRLVLLLKTHYFKCYHCWSVFSKVKSCQDITIFVEKQTMKKQQHAQQTLKRTKLRQGNIIVVKITYKTHRNITHMFMGAKPYSYPINPLLDEQC